MPTARAATTARRPSLLGPAMICGTLPWVLMILTPVGDGRRLALIPLRDIAEQLADGPVSAAVQIDANLVVFATVGLLAPIRWRLRVRTVALGAAAGSATLEAIQYAAAMGRVSSVDDVLLNAAGATLAALLATRWLRRGARLRRWHVFSAVSHRGAGDSEPGELTTLHR